MMPDVARDLAALARAARRAPLDRPDLVAAFTLGAISRGPIDPAALLEVLERAGIAEHRWKEAAEAFSPPAWTQRAGPVLRSPLLARLGAAMTSYATVRSARPATSPLGAVTADGPAVRSRAGRRGFRRAGKLEGSPT
jgi:hypothetical protein